MFLDDQKKDDQLAEDMLRISRQLESLSTEMRTYGQEKTEKCNNDFFTIFFNTKIGDLKLNFNMQLSKKVIYSYVDLSSCIKK